MAVLIRLLLSVLVTGVVAAATLHVRDSLHSQNVHQVALVAESESRASRAQIVRNFEDLLASLDAMRRIWLTQGEILRREWSDEVEQLFETVPGLRLVVWDDPGHGARLARHRKGTAIDSRLDPRAFRPYSALIKRGRDENRSMMAGPYLDDEGKPFFEIYLIDPRPRVPGGLLVAVVDATPMFASLLGEDSPGWAVRVDWRDVSLFQRGQPATDPVPESWICEGDIRTSLGSTWTVRHYPTDQLAATLDTRAADLVLVLGLVIAVLMGALTFENWRAHSRARAAIRAELELAALNASLEREIEQRTRALANRTADLQMVTDSVAHDLRNPMNSIAMNIELFRARFGEELPDGAEKILGRINPAVRQMANILDRMLGLAAVTHKTFDREKLDMTTLVRETYDDLTASEPEPPARLVLDQLPEVRADRTLVSMMLTNLLANALKYTRGREDAEIRVSAEHVNGVTEYRVSDNGNGFDQRQAVKMFRAFERLDTDGPAEGVGLGLSIVARVVERHEGRIRAEGEPGNGASFLFTLEPEPDTG